MHKEKPGAEIALIRDLKGRKSETHVYFRPTVLWIKFGVPSNSDVEALTPQCDVIGRQSLREVIKCR